MSTSPQNSEEQALALNAEGQARIAMRILSHSTHQSLKLRLLGAKRLKSVPAHLAVERFLLALPKQSLLKLNELCREAHTLYAPARR
jgi:hypothetical protein